jgi:hypothetical protein
MSRDEITIGVSYLPLFPSILHLVIWDALLINYLYEFFQIFRKIIFFITNIYIHYFIIIMLRMTVHWFFLLLVTAQCSSLATRKGFENHLILYKRDLVFQFGRNFWITSYSRETGTVLAVIIVVRRINSDFSIHTPIGNFFVLVYGYSVWIRNNAFSIY